MNSSADQWMMVLALFFFGFAMSRAYRAGKAMGSNEPERGGRLGLLAVTCFCAGVGLISLQVQKSPNGKPASINELKVGQTYRFLEQGTGLFDDLMFLETPDGEAFICACDASFSEEPDEVVVREVSAGGKKFLRLVPLKELETNP